MKKRILQSCMAAALAMAALASCEDGLTAGTVQMLTPPDGGDFFAVVPALTAGTATAPGGVVGNFAEGPAYSLVDAAGDLHGKVDRDNGRFVVDGTELKVGEAALTSGAYYIFIQASKGGAAFSVTGSFYVAEGGGPTDFGFTQTENIIFRSVKADKGKTAGVFDDVEGGSGPYSYMLVAGNGENDADNSYFDISESALRIKNTLPRGGVYNIYVRVIDSAEKVFEKNLTITVEESLAVPTAMNIDEEMVTVISVQTAVTGSDSYKIPTDSTAAAYQLTMFPSKRNLTLDPYKMSKYEITYGQWYEVVHWATEEAPGSNKYTFANLGSPIVSGTPGQAPADETRNIPVININWRDAVVWCNALSEYTEKEPVYYLDVNKDGSLDNGDTVVRASSNTVPESTGDSWNPSYSSGLSTDDYVVMDKTKTGYRLPVEAEWEFAARGGDVTDLDWMYRWAGSNNYVAAREDYAWGKDSAPDPANPSPQPVGLKLPNRLGLHDMSGNVSEFCWDWKDTVYTDSSPDATIGIDGYSGTVNSNANYGRICRGGNINGDIYSAASSTVSVTGRSSVLPNAVYSTMPIGLRIVSKCN